MKGHLARLVAVFASALFAFALGVSLVGCGANDEESIRSAIDAELGTIVSSDDDTYAELVEAAGVDQLEQFGIDGTEFVESWLDGFSYEIGEITVEDDTATAEITITCKQLYGIITEWSEGVTDELSAQNFTSTDEVYAWAGQSMMEAIDAGQTTTTTITMDLEKDGNSWTLPETTDNQQALIEAMVGDVSLSSLL